MDTTMEIQQLQKTDKLSHSSQWSRWIAQVELQAKLYRIWEYVNPDLPTEPQLPDVPELEAPGDQLDPGYANRLAYRKELEDQLERASNKLARFNIYLDS
jgi:hypothetical protein